MAIFLENINDLGKESNPNLTYLWEAFAAIGHTGAAKNVRRRGVRPPAVSEKGVLHLSQLAGVRLRGGGRPDLRQR
eukprot:221036-Pyramimonas_sp.AAC.1